MLRFNSVVLITTNICNLKCRHCYPTSGPSKDLFFRYGNSKTLTAQQAEKYIRQIPHLENVKQHLHIGGGESTLFVDDFKELVTLGQKYGLSVSFVTNCSWAKDQKSANEFIKDLHERGLTFIEASLSVFHQEYLDVEFPIRAIRACKKSGVGVLLRPVITRSASAAKTLERISDDDLKGVAISTSKCTPIGRARLEIPTAEFLYDDIEYGGCEKILNLTIRQDGSVYPCCAGADVTNALRLGNADNEPLTEILKRAELDPLLVTLFEQGPRYLAELLYESGGKNFLKERHVNICHLCNDLFINDDIAEDVRRALQQRIHQLGSKSHL